MLNNQIQNKGKFDLEDRTTNFARKIVRFCKTLPQNAINIRLIPQ